MYFIQTFPGGKGDSIQFDELPAASQALLGKVYQYVGPTNSSYTHNYFYECKLVGANYEWVYTDVEMAETETISLSDFDQLPQSEKDNGTVYFVPDANTQRFFAVRTGFTPVGTVISVLGTIVPRLYLPCLGGVYNISEYPELATHFEENYGSKNYFGGDGTTTFAVPNLIGVPEDTIYCIAIKNIYVETRQDFSAGEKMIGTWINGKSIYQKTIVTSLPTVVTDGVMVSRFVDTDELIDEIIMINATRINQDDHAASSMPFVTFGTNLYQMYVRGWTNDASSGNKNKIEICSNAVDWNGATVYVTIQYTKASV